MHQLRSALVFFALAGLASISCKAKDAAPADADGGAGTAASGLAATLKAAVTPAPAELTFDELSSKLAPTTCKMLDECKNDKVKATVTMSAMMVASFGTFDKPELQKQVSAVGKTMKAEKRWLPSETECTTVGGIALKALGMSSEALKDRVGKSVAYDGKKGAACVEALAKAPEACKTEVKLATEPKFKEIDAFSKELHDPLDAYAKPCEDVVTGLLEAGAACEYDVECKGKGLKCSKGKDPKNPKAKTCQAKSTK